MDTTQCDADIEEDHEDEHGERDTRQEWLPNFFQAGSILQRM